MQGTLPIWFAFLTLAAQLPAAAQPQVTVNSLGMKLVKIEAGEFIMGAGDKRPVTEAEWKRNDWDESPAHRVKISAPFFVSTTEVTNAEYEQFDPQHKAVRGTGDASRTDSDPVTMVTWQQAVEFCKWLSKKESKTYRLPTEAEWEYCCRAGTTTVFNTGSTLTAKQANIAGRRNNRLQAVATYKPNAWGLYDMHGNVEEWCLDWYGAYLPGHQKDPGGRASGYAKVTRGGSYDPASWQDDNARYCRSANRSGRLPDDANRCTGFRIVAGELPASGELPAAEVPRFARNVKQQPARISSPSAKPFFDDFKGRQPTIPDNTWGPTFSKWNHYTACCVCPNGDVLACWYTTKSEAGRELAQAASRLPAGSNTWQPASLFFDVPDVNDHAPVLLTHKKRIYHFASQSIRGWDETTNVMRTSSDNGATWSQPRIIFRRTGPHNLSQACSAFTGSNGAIYLAVDGSAHRTESVLVSEDDGETWKVATGDLRKAVGGKYAIHPAIAPAASNGMVAFLRGPDPMPRLVSHDQGSTWVASDTQLGGIGVGQKAAALRLKSGALLVCVQDARKPPLTGKRGTLAAVSHDDGKTWSKVRHVPGVGGYMSAAQAADGTIYVFGTRMHCVAFNEAWLDNGQAIK